MKRSPKLTEDQIHELNTFVRNGKHSGREVRRAQVILLVDQEVDTVAITAVTHFKRRQIFDLRKNYLHSGLPAIADKRKGAPKELLTKRQREEVLAILKKKTPKEYGYTQDFWTTGILGAVIEELYKAKYKSKTSLYLIFRQARFTYHKPGRVYDKHSEEEVEKWRKVTKPKLKKILKEENTVILSADEMILTTETTTQKVWLPQGEYPKIECRTGGRKRRSVYGFLNLKTGEEHAFKTELQNMYVTKEILEQVRALYPKQKIALFWDNAGWHRGSIVQEFIKKDENIEVIHFPTYAPEENPQEHVWKSGRAECTHNEFIQDIDKATDGLVEYFNATRFPYELLGFSAVS